MEHTWREAYNIIHNECVRLELHTYFTVTLSKVINVTLEWADPHAVADHDPFYNVVVSQAIIGHYHTIIGFMAKAWTDTLENINVKHLAQMMKQVLAMLWDHVYEQLCLVRKSIRHSTESHAVKEKTAQMGTKLLWYQWHQDEVLDY